MSVSFQGMIGRYGLGPLTPKGPRKPVSSLTAYTPICEDSCCYTATEYCVI